MKKINLLPKLGTSPIVASTLIGLCLFTQTPMKVHAEESSTYQVAQQKIAVSGQVVSEQGEPIIGATILVKGTGKGTITDIDGNFELSAAKGAELVVSYIGYKAQTLKVVSSAPMHIVLETAAESLEEVVVVGYGVVKKSDLTSSIATVKGKELNKMVASNPLAALQGKVSGVQITNTSGAPGSSPRVIIRGVTTQNGSTPLYVVDGVPGVALKSINSADIASMEILKDAAATSIYGTNGSNGVVLITTKTGKLNTKMKFSISAKHGLQHVKRPSIASAEEYKKVYTARYENDGLPVPVGFDDAADTDWWGEVTDELAPIQDYNLSFNGGGKRFAYNASIGYFRQDAQNKGRGYWDRITARFNTSYKVNDVVKFGQDFAPIYESSDSYYTGAMGTAMQYDPTTPVYKSAEEQEGLNDYSIYAQSRHTTVWNPAAAQARQFGKNKQYGFLSNTYVQVKPIDCLTLRSQFGMDLMNYESSNFSPEFNIGGTEKNEVNSVSSAFSRGFKWTWNNTATFMKTFAEKHNVTGMVGFVMEEKSTNRLSGSKESIANSYTPNLRYINSATLNPSVSGIVSEYSLMSYLGRVMYNYDNRYYLTATYRVDGSSKFLGENQYAQFPSVSAAYNLKNEDFLKDNELISKLKLRASWGKVGNQNIPIGAFEDKIVPAQSVLGNGVQIGSKLSAIGNKEIQWEVIEDYNIGVDFGLNNYFTLSAEWFSKESHDMLMQASNLLITGLPMNDAKMWTNIGSMKATGFELALGVSDHSNELKYDVNLNMTTVKNTAETLVDNAPQYTGSFLQLPTHKTEPGGEIGRFFLYQADGLFRTQEEVDAHVGEDGTPIQPNAQPGDLRFKDLNNDGKLDDSDKAYSGSSLPKMTFGLNCYLEYKSFDFTLSVTGNMGNKILNAQKQRLYTGYAGVNVIGGLSDKVWTPENINASIPRLSSKDLNGNYKTPSTFFLEDGDFAKIQNIQVGYTFNMEKFYNMKCRVYASAQNLYTFTKYSGADPEVASGGGVLSSGVDWFPYAQPRTFILGVNLDF